MRTKTPARELGGLRDLRAVPGCGAAPAGLPAASPPRARSARAAASGGPTCGAAGSGRTSLPRWTARRPRTRGRAGAATSPRSSAPDSRETADRAPRSRTAGDGGRRDDGATRRTGSSSPERRRHHSSRMRSRKISSACSARRDRCRRRRRPRTAHRDLRCDPHPQNCTTLTGAGCCCWRTPDSPAGAGIQGSPATSASSER